MSMCRPVNFPTVRFRDWLKRYNVDIEITDPDGQTVSQTTFAPAAPVTEDARPGSDGGAGWAYADGVPAAPPRRRQRPTAARGGVICHAGGGQSPRPVQLGLGHPMLQLPTESVSVPVEMLGSDGPSATFTPPPSSSGPSPSELYQAQPPPDPESCVPSEDGCGYGSLPVEEEDRKEDLPASEMPVSGWPDVTLEHPESSRAVVTVDSQNFEEDASDQPLAGSSVDAYFQDGQPAGSDGHFGSRCFASDEAAQVDQHWTAGVIESPGSNRSITDMDATQLDHPGNQCTEASPDDAGRPVLDMNNGGAFPVVIEPTGNTAAMVEGFSECFADGGGGSGYQLAYEAVSDQELYRTGEDAGFNDAAGPEAGTTTPPSQTTCLDLGSDFADLLGNQHSEEFDYHLSYVNTVSSNLPSKDLSADVPRESRRSRVCRTRSYPKSVAMRNAGPASKSFRRDSVDH